MHKQINTHVHKHTRREPSNEVGEDGWRSWLFLCGCVFEREREREREGEMHGVSFRTRSLSGTDYVMAKWSREGEGGQNKTDGGRERDRTIHGLSVTVCQTLPEPFPLSNFCYLSFLPALSGQFLSDRPHSDFTRAVTLSSYLT